MVEEVNVPQLGKPFLLQVATWCYYQPCLFRLGFTSATNNQEEVFSESLQDLQQTQLCLKFIMK